jgi:AcrR family transcriptional regulator
MTALKTRTRKGEHTGQRILDAAEQLFAEHGFAGTSIRDVTARAGIQKA